MENNGIKIGRFLFDSLTLGMYNNPLCVYREYIQNSADAINKSTRNNELNRNDACIRINIDDTKKNITIEDNGCGINKGDVSQILLSVGESQKRGSSRELGFRGIGRLGGMAYCKELIFETKAKGENVVSINTWDCDKIAKMLNPNDPNFRGTSLMQVIQDCTKIKQVPAEKGTINNSFFRVSLKEINRQSNLLLNADDVRNYLSQVAPVPFNHQKFPLGREIDENLLKEIPNFNTFKILVNYEEVFKPYKTTILIGKNKTDAITNITEFNIPDNTGKTIAKGWRANRKDFIGRIPKPELVGGIRVRVGNIQLGDEDLLDKVFREERFNAYLIGEIHITDPNLIPNSRRDDFEESNMKEFFYQGVRIELGEPESEKIRETSKEKNRWKIVKKAEDCILTVKQSSKEGFVSPKHQEKAVKDLRYTRDELQCLIDKNKKDSGLKNKASKQINDATELLEKLKKKNTSIIDNLPLIYTSRERELIKKICGCIYDNYDKSQDAVDLVERIARFLDK